MTAWAYIYEHPDTDPADDRVIIDRANQRTYLVPVPHPADAPAVASALIDEGIELIELCGGFALADAARVADAVAGRVPVGHVTFAVDSGQGLAAYSAQFEAEQSPA